LAADWKDLITDILIKTKEIVRPEDNTDVDLTSVITSSFSFGIRYSDTFRRTAVGINGFLREIWDFDANYCKGLEKGLARSLHGQTSGSLRIIQYDQGEPKDPGIPTANGHAPVARWSKYKTFSYLPELKTKDHLLQDQPKNSDQVHGKMTAHIFYAACSVSGVGFP
jgi:hypothetical protein